MKKVELENKIQEATSSLIDIATDICWNKISRNCLYIMSEIDESIGKNFFEHAKIRKRINDKKAPKTLNRIVAELSTIYENLYDINLHIYKSLRNKTIIEIRYFLKTSHIEEFYPTIKDNEPMLHCKVSRPFYVTESPNSNKPERKFDVNWELGGIRHEWNKFIGKLKYHTWKIKYDRKRKYRIKNES
ncbi:hypothetical protein DMZ43_11035 [Meridianimaribacter sp. CL38]|uniref:hypothetical protein n=1 Tax=Meridianimaribacter sp. CL38 TaxID=2213021 RepID=UPI00103D2BFA|nr:hypothetical protein [Meridianimaribacter sp. CL38]TBV25477.1 hypothetical protein DMZ43_11035 [Meridianimaribacter sp. CL38]